MKKLTEVWLAIIRWQGWKTFARSCVSGWQALIHWKGWRSFVHWNGWSAIAGWKLWRPHPLILFLLAAASAGGLCWVFLMGMESHPLSYAVYVLAAYTLAALVCTLPGLIRRLFQTIHAHPRLEQALHDHELQFRLELYGEQVINFGYGIFKCVAAFFYADAWMGADGFYNLVQGIIQLFQILRRKSAKTLQQQWKSYRFCGILVLIMHLSTTGIAFLILHDHMYEEYPGFMIFATAAFTFYKLISSFIDVAKDRKHPHPIDSSVRLLDFSQALFNLFCLQVAMIHAFGPALSYGGLMNTLTGSIVSLMMSAMGIYMIRRANRELKKL